MDASSLSKIENSVPVEVWVPTMMNVSAIFSLITPTENFNSETYVFYVFLNGPIKSGVAKALAVTSCSLLAPSSFHYLF